MGLHAFGIWRLHGIVVQIDEGYLLGLPDQVVVLVAYQVSNPRGRSNGDVITEYADLMITKKIGGVQRVIDVIQVDGMDIVGPCRSNKPI